MNLSLAPVNFAMVSSPSAPSCVETAGSVAFSGGTETAGSVASSGGSSGGFSAIA